MKEQQLKIIQELHRYNTKPCNLFHEKVIDYIASDDRLKTEAIYKRAGFCDKETRRWRLGCAHTMANHNYILLLKKLITAGILDLSMQFIEEIEEIIMSICLMDHHKGDIEKQFIQASIQRDQLKLKELSEQKKIIAKQHLEKIVRLENFRQTALHRIEQISTS